MPRLASSVSAATPVLLMLNFVTSFAEHIRTRTRMNRGWVGRYGSPAFAIDKATEGLVGCQRDDQGAHDPTTIAPLS